MCIESLTIKALRQGDVPGEINATVEPSAKHRPGIFAKVNYHCVLPGEAVHAGAAELTLKFIEADWKSACGMARKVAEKILEKIKPDHE